MKVLGLFFLGVTFFSGPQRSKTVLLDTYYNNEWKTDATGKRVRYHYTWDDQENSGFSKLGRMFAAQGAQLESLQEAPSANKLKNADIYILVDPDTERETAKPNDLTAAAATTIADWVHKGGVLVLMANDSGNARLQTFNTLASKFGIHFNSDNYNRVINDQYEQGAIIIPRDHQLFRTAKKIFVKELSTLRLSSPATAVLRKEGKDIVAVSKYGRGTVFAIGDPWLYNEYVNGRLPAGFDNERAAQDLVRWLLFSAHK